jgi:transcriptional regulator with XRE-family HTH domain
MMTKEEFVLIRKKLEKTQREISLLLGVSQNTVESYEQGSRNIPGNIERILYFLLFKLNMNKNTERTICWEEKKCPLEIRQNCIAWLAREGFFCWFMTGKTCRIEKMSSPERTANCFGCSFFKENLNKI